MPKICATGKRWLAEVEGPTQVGLFIYRYRAKSSNIWEEASAGSENEEEYRPPNLDPFRKHRFFHGPDRRRDGLESQHRVQDEPHDDRDDDDRRQVDDYRASSEFAAQQAQ